MFGLLTEKLTHKERIKNLLSDGKWHSFRELNKICFRYSARLHDLKEEGRFHDKKLINGIWFYKMELDK